MLAHVGNGIHLISSYHAPGAMSSDVLAGSTPPVHRDPLYENNPERGALDHHDGTNAVSTGHKRLRFHRKEQRNQKVLCGP